MIYRWKDIGTGVGGVGKVPVDEFARLHGIPRRNREVPTHDAIEPWPPYVEPMWLRFLRWLVQ